MSQSPTPSPRPINLDEAKLAIRAIEKFARIENSHSGTHETEVILRLTVGLRRKLDTYRR